MKVTAPNKEQIKAFDKAKLNRATWAVMKEMKNSLIVKHRITGEIRVIEK